LLEVEVDHFYFIDFVFIAVILELYWEM